LLFIALVFAKVARVKQGAINNAKLPGEDSEHLKRVKTVWWLGSAPDPAGGAYIDPLDPPPSWWGGFPSPRQKKKSWLQPCGNNTDPNPKTDPIPNP